MACKLLETVLIFLTIDKYYVNLRLSSLMEVIITMHCRNLSKCSILVDILNY